MDKSFNNELIKIFEADQIKLNEPMWRHTTLHIGGEADYMVLPSSADQIRQVIIKCREYNMPYYIMGRGSNLLVSDSGYRGLIIKLTDRLSEIKIEEDGMVKAQAGVLMSRLAEAAAEQSLTGLEFASGIPGTLGGAVTMNAGAYGGEMKQCLVSATVIDGEGEIHVLKNEDLKLGYRTSILQNGSLCLLDASMKLAKGDRQQIKEKMRELNYLRRMKQPLDQYSAGSTFKRPQGYYAGKLICDAGLKGYQVGGAAVSEKHCGFLINKDNATAKDFINLINDVVRIVEEKFGVRLEPEVKFLGQF